jgi:hypothetical protein
MAAPTYSFENALTAKSWVSVAAGDTITPSPIAIWVGTAGNLVMTDASGNTETFKNVASGTAIRCAPVVIEASSTAADFVAFFG